MCSLLQNKRKYRHHNKLTKKKINELIKEVDRLETTTNQMRDKPSKNARITTKLIPDKTNLGHRNLRQK